MALAIDRDAFITILSEGKFKKGTAMLPAPEGRWAMPEEMMATIPGYSPDVAGNRAKALKIMEGAGYTKDNPLKVKVSTRNIAIYRDPAVILIDQLKQINIAAELDVIETSQWHAKVARKDYQVGLNLTGVGVDDPDVNFYENYWCTSQRNYTRYCNKELEKLIEKQSTIADFEKRRKLVWEIDKKLQEDVARPIIYHGRWRHLLAAKSQGYRPPAKLEATTAGASSSKSGSTSRHGDWRTAASVAQRPTGFSGIVLISTSGAGPKLDPERTSESVQRLRRDAPANFHRSPEEACANDYWLKGTCSMTGYMIRRFLLMI